MLYLILNRKLLSLTFPLLNKKSTPKKTKQKNQNPKQIPLQIIRD